MMSALRTSAGGNAAERRAGAPQQASRLCAAATEEHVPMAFDTSKTSRPDAAKERRDYATRLSTSAPFPTQVRPADEEPPYLFSFTKGLAHGVDGMLIEPADFDAFRQGTQSHDPNDFDKVRIFAGDFLTAKPQDFKGLPGDPKPVREWESPTAGHAYVLQGPDPFALAMPQAPRAGSAEFAAEMAEVYQMALSRDWVIAGFMDAALVNALETGDGAPLDQSARDRLRTENDNVAAAAAGLSGMRWFKGEATDENTDEPVERARRRFNERQTPRDLFRGQGEDRWSTPFLSQFMVMGSGGPSRELAGRLSGRIVYGAQTIDQRVRVAIPGKDWMTRWEDYIDVQNGLHKRALVGAEEFTPGATRLMATLRDMATYVHDDQLYQAYLNAALILLAERFPFDPGIPYHDMAANPRCRNNTDPFALFGAPHLLTLVTEVSSRALKAVRLQKFTVHRRLRPEAAGALFHTIYSGYHPHRSLPNTTPFPEIGGTPQAKAREKLGRTLARHTFPEPSGGDDRALEPILEKIRLHNARLNGDEPEELGRATWLLPMAFPEGSPMHPAYGAGHATVAGACVTLLKAIFSMTDPKNPDRPVFLVEPGDRAVVPGMPTALNEDVDPLTVKIQEGLTLEGELNKLIWNISNARNIAGVHYYTDYIESALLGEAVTLGILREQMAAYHPAEGVTMTVPLLTPRTLPDCLLNGPDGGQGQIGPNDVVAAVTIRPDGVLEAASATPGR
jgi:hypothetical protein